MFTGIVQEVGTVVRLQPAAGVIRLSVSAPKIAPRVERLESVAVNGVCLTVVQRRHEVLEFEVIAQTRHLTILSRLRSGQRVNLEPSLTLTDRLGGQLLFGHVDGTGIVRRRRSQAGGWALTIQLPQPLRRYLVSKGPVAIDGVSLTVGTITPTGCVVHLIPETLRQTTLGTMTQGRSVNIELDYFAKLLWRWQRVPGAVI